MARPARDSVVRLSPRFRIYCGGDVALGPGKVGLLRAIQETGSIRRAAFNLQMSYMRAWKLIKTMNTCFKGPLVNAARGGLKRGGAKLTPMGITALKLYEQLEAESLSATEHTWRELEGLLRR